MSHLHATLRALLPLNWPIEEVMTKASHTFCESTLPAQFAPLVLGRADSDGNVELVNAGHTPVLIVDDGGVQVIPAASLPLGMFCSTDFTSVKRTLNAEGMLFLYSDGIAESADEAGNEYDLNRLVETVGQLRGRPSSELVEIIRNQIAAYTNGARAADDRSMLALHYPAF
jgi:sigma-B regulation protein RsbU (phosphoserine phosphatase)